ncbi:hypothetical protein GCK32_019719 [Trichostrongylus colubriformis]|uniref:CCHC-type domain-containing protein n=1 Tax=Trichostrongylus colubriformis TaxID=6319 RepID=A0AAN8F9I5_TRICO
MSNIASCKANLTKAISALESVRGKIPASLLSPVDVNTCDFDLDACHAQLQSHLSQIRASLRTVKDRHQVFLNLVANSVTHNADSKAYETYMQESRVEEVISAAEATVASLRSRISELNTLIEQGPAPTSSDVVHEKPRDYPKTPSYASVSTQPNIQTQQSYSVPSLSPQQPTVQPTSSLFGPLSTQPAIQLGKLTLEPFTGDITQFHRFWCAFELLVHNDPNTPPVHKFLYLQSLLKGEAQVVLQDLDPDECNYSELVRALKTRYDRPYRTRALLHKQLQQLPAAHNNGSDLRNTWFRVSGILHGLRRYEDFRTVLPLLDLVKSKFPSEIQQKLHDLEFQTNSDFDLDQVMQKLDYIIASKEKYEDSTTLRDSFSVNTSHQRSPSRPSSSRRSSRSSFSPTRCCFCEAKDHSSSRCRLDIPVVARRTIARLSGLCWKCLREGHSVRSCRYPSCRVCGRDHHDLLCQDTSRDRHRSRRDRHRDDSQYRSPRRYSSRSPSEDDRRHYRSSRTRRSRSYSRDRHDSRRRYDTRHSSRSHSPQRVTFHSPIRDRSGHRTRHGSPYPQRDRSFKSDDEAESSCHADSPPAHSISASRSASLMLVKANAFNCDTARLQEVILFLDSGAQKSFIASSTVQRLGLRVLDKEPRTFITFGGYSTTEISGVVQLTLVDLHGDELVVAPPNRQSRCANRHHLCRQKISTLFDIMDFLCLCVSPVPCFLTFLSVSTTFGMSFHRILPFACLRAWCCVILGLVPSSRVTRFFGWAIGRHIRP